MLQAVSSSHSASAPVVSSSITSPPMSCKGGRRKPLEILTGIFSRKNNRETPEHSEGKDNFFLSDDDIWDDSEIPEPRECLHSPYHARRIDEDMHNLRLSRQDNPFLQVLASRERLNNESDDGSDYEEKNLMSKENMSGHSRDPLSLEEVHARLIRSPPPILSFRNNQNSDPAFGHYLTSAQTSSDSVFQFPPVHSHSHRHHHASTSLSLTEPSPTLSCRSHGQGHGHKILGPFKKENTLDILTGKFNLSPQPRRKPPHKSFSEFS